MTTSISGLSGSGIDVGSLVQQLVAADRAPATTWNSQRLDALSEQSAWSDLSSKLSAVRTVAEALATTGKASPTAATTGTPSVLTAVGADGAAPTSATIKVLNLATAQQRTSGALGAPSTVVGAGTAVLTSGLAAAGLTRVAVDPGLPAGRHTVQVRPPGSATVAADTEPELDWSSGGSFTFTDSTGPHPITIPAKVYDSAADLASALQTAMQPASGTGPSVSVRNGVLVVTSPDTGPDALVQLDSSGDAGRLGMSGAWSYGTGYTASLDGGDPVELTAGEDTRLTDPDGEAVTLTAGAGGFTAGTVVMNVVRTTATSTLQDLTKALNAAGSPVSASLVNSGDGSATPYRLVVTATETGTRGAVDLDTTGSPFLAGLGLDGPTRLVAGKDASLEIGGTTVTRSSNTVSDLLPDVTLTLLTPGESTVSVARDAAGTTTKVKALVDGLNAFLNAVATQTKNGANGTGGGPLAGGALARSLSQQVFSVGSGAVGSAGVPSLSSLGIQISREGRYTLDEAALGKAVTADPDGVSSLLSSFAGGMAAFAKSMTQVGGTLSSAQSAAGDKAKSKQDQIDALDERLIGVQARYTSQYARLDAALGMLNSQRSQLASALAGLGTG